MKKVILFAGIILSMASCETKQQKDLTKKLEEQKCRAEFSIFLSENSTNMQLLLIDEGYKKELDEFNEMRKDTLITCDSIKSAWDNLSAKALR